MTIVILAIAWLAGLWLAAQLHLSLWTWLSFAAAGVLLAIPFRRQRIHFLILAAACLAGARYETAQPILDAAHVAYYNDQRDLTLTGVVTSEPDVRDWGLLLRLRAESLTLPGGSPRPVTGWIQLTAPPYPRIPYGARLSVHGDLTAPPEADGFDYPAFLARRGIYSHMAQPAITILAEGEGTPLLESLLDFKARLRAAIYRLLPGSQAALLAAILLGDRGNLAPDLADAFQATGLTHLIVVSGVHITLLAAVLAGLTRSFLGRRTAFLLTIIAVALYVLMVGAAPPVARAALMSLAYLFSWRILGRPTFTLAPLFLSAWAITVANPLVLWDAGFQFSFAAVLGLLLYAAPWRDWAALQLEGRLPPALLTPINFLLQIPITTLAAQIMLLPLVILHTRHFPLIGLPANILALPAQPPILILGGMASLAALIVPPLGQLLAWTVWPFLAFTTAIARALAGSPGPALPVELPPPLIWLLYAAIAAATWILGNAERRALWRERLAHHLYPAAAGSMAIVATLAVAAATGQPDGLLHVAFLDVGQGDAIFIQTPSGRQILVDGGPHPDLLNDRLGQQLPFWDRHIDIVIATHPDADHIGGLPPLLARYGVDALLTDGSGEDAPTFDALLSAAATAGLTPQAARAGETILIGDGVRLEIPHPGPERHENNRNENSVALRLLYGNFSLLLTGDAGQWAEQQMLASGRPLGALILKAGHHGARDSTTLPFLTAVRPQYIIISAGTDNLFGHPHPEVLDRAIGATVLRTDKLGTIEVTTDGERMWWQSRR